MDKYFVEGEQTSKRVRLNKSDVFGYGSRQPTGIPSTSSSSSDRSKHHHHHHHRGSSSTSNLQSEQMLTIMQELLQQTNVMAKDLSKLRSTQSNRPADNGDILCHIWQELTTIRQDLDMLHFRFSGCTFGSLLLPTSAGELLTKATRSLAHIEGRLASIQIQGVVNANGTSNDSHNKSSSRGKGRSQPQTAYYQSPEFATYAAQPRTSTPKFSFVGFKPFPSPSVHVLASQLQPNFKSGAPAYIPDPHFSTQTPYTFGKPKRKEHGSTSSGYVYVNDAVTCYRADLYSKAIKRLEKKQHQGPEPMEWADGY